MMLIAVIFTGPGRSNVYVYDWDTQRTEELVSSAVVISDHFKLSRDGLVFALLLQTEGDPYSGTMIFTRYSWWRLSCGCGASGI